MQRMVLWSGGPDSTKCLIDVLEQTDDPVIAFHLHGDIPVRPMDEGVIEGERNSIKTLTPILKERYRDFELKEFSHRRFVFDEKDHVGYEIFTFPLIYALDGTPVTVYQARNKDEWDSLEIEQSTTTGENWGLRNTLFEVGDIEIVQHNLHKPKAEIVRELGDLFPLTWSCMGPSKEAGVPCEQCVWCGIRRKAEMDAKSLVDGV